MAERQKYENDNVPTLPQRGKVKDVCQKWLVHEDGALAYVMQNEEIDNHFGLNRFHRRTVREDVPIARSAQEDEEIRQQEERLRQIEELTRQAAEDEALAKAMADKMDIDERRLSASKARSDEEYARQMQIREQRRYDRQREKRAERHLEQERLKIEERLIRQTEDARISAPGSQSGGDTSFTSTDHDHSSPRDTGTRVTHTGVIEDEGDFSDFYLQPSTRMEPDQRRQLQEVQDEELARLLQEQEHKRTKAEVSRTKLRDIEKGDEQLAKVMQEQEKLRMLKARHRKQRSDRSHDRLNDQSYRQGIDPNRAASLDDRNPGLSDLNGHGISHRQYRESHTESNRGENYNNSADGHDLSPTDAGMVEQWLTGQSEGLDNYRRNFRSDDLGSERNSQPSPSRPDDSRVSPRVSGEAILEGRLSGTNSQQNRPIDSRHRNRSSEMNSQHYRSNDNKPVDNTQRNRPNVDDSVRNRSTDRNFDRQEQRERSTERYTNESYESGDFLVDHSENNNFNDRHQKINTNTYIEPRTNGHTDRHRQDITSVGHGGSDSLSSSHDRYERRSSPNSKSTVRSTPPDSFNRNEDTSQQAFNIAMAIDPTYHRRQHEINTSPTEPTPAFMSQTYEQPDMEWDPSVRGSLRRQRPYIAPDSLSQNTGPNSVTMEESGETDDSTWLPVQGQRRSTIEKGRGSNYKKAPPSSKKGGCKQQ